MTERDELRTERCVACHRDSPRVTAEERATLGAMVPDWTIDEAARGPRLVRPFRFKTYSAALAFTQRVGDLAEREDHHPVILTEVRRVTVTWWTHAIGGLHRNDFIMAAKTDDAYAQETA